MPALRRILVLVALVLSGCAVTEYERLYGAWSDGEVTVALERGGTFEIRGAQRLFDADFVGDVGHLAGRYTVASGADLFVDGGEVANVAMRFNLLRIGSYSVERMLGVLEQDDPQIRDRVGNTVYQVELLSATDGEIRLYSEALFGGEVGLVPSFRIDDLLATNLAVFVGLTLVLFGGAAFLSGQALANGWKPPLTGVFYCALLAFADMFLVYGLFDGDGTLIVGYLIRFAVLTGIFLLSYRLTQARKMVSQYPWLNERSGLFGWRSRPGASAD